MAGFADIDVAALPKPFDEARAERTFVALAEIGVVPDEPQRALLRGAFGNSAYLARLAIRESAFLRELLASEMEAVQRRIEALAASVAHAPAMAPAMADLRRAKRHLALALALADIAGLLSLDDFTSALTQFADAAVGGALGYLLRERAMADGLAQGPLAANTGLVVLAMGKYGAGELNYSSDIDLVVFYDADKFPFRKRGDARGAAVDIVRGLVKMIGEITADGYVFRTDLRLRPDAGATQVAISTEAAEAYYESMGQNWERAAMIKARACAGDPASGAAFLKALEPFVWRRNLDFAAIEDIHSIKRQIHAHGGHGAIAVEGHNIKLGRGGIREIEFFVQTQQLILGGRNPSLRARQTLVALEALHRLGRVSDQAAEELAESYRFLRRLEHRLQMIDDDQTHSLPKSEQGVAHVACFMGFSDAAFFRRRLTHHLERVQTHYAQLFEKAPALGVAAGSLVFTGVEDDPGTLETLKRLGFRDPEHVAAAIRGWHHGRVRATRSARARELLTKLVPPLLDALAASADPDVAFAQFDRFVSRVPTGVQLFSLLLANPALLDAIATIAGSAPRLAEWMGRNPAVLDALLDPGFLREVPRRAEIDVGLGAELARTGDYEAVLTAARRFAKELVFRVGAQVVLGTANAGAAGAGFADIAECVISGLLPRVEDELASSAGRIPGGGFVVVAMGKLGGREMTAGSDLDLIFIYDAPADIETSGGPTCLAAPTYFARLAQRLIAALTVQTPEGALYEVDMRLRPSGNKGPVAVSLESFMRYYLEGQAWTWELLALTRARVVAGPARLREKVEATIRDALTAPVERAAMRRDAREMREKLAVNFPPQGFWDLKFARGGLVDIEFLCQFLQLAHACRDPGILEQNTVAALKRLKISRLLPEQDADATIEAAELQQSLTQVLRIAVEGVLDARDASHGLKLLLARAGAAPGFESLEVKLAAAQSRARAVFDGVL